MRAGRRRRRPGSRRRGHRMSRVNQSAARRGGQWTPSGTVRRSPLRVSAARRCACPPLAAARVRRSPLRVSAARRCACLPLATVRVRRSPLRVSAARRCACPPLAAAPGSSPVPGREAAVGTKRPIYSGATPDNRKKVLIMDPFSVAQRRPPWLRARSGAARRRSPRPAMLRGRPRTRRLGRRRWMRRLGRGILNTGSHARPDMVGLMK